MSVGVGVATVGGRRLARLVVSAAALLAVGLLVFVVAVGVLLGGGRSSAAPPSGGSACVSSGPVAGLRGGQAEVARTIVATANPVGGRAAATLAVMVGLAESGLLNLSGGDRDSLGVFQQRANWGSAAQRTDPVWATTALLTASGKGLVSVSGWSRLAPWLAAQRVQGSAWDGHTAQADGLAPARDAVTGRVVPPDGYGIGANYQAQYTRAAAIVARIETDSANLTCGGVSTRLPGGLGGHRGLPRSYNLATTGASKAAAGAILYALNQLNKPYRFGAAGPDSFDCSGLMVAAWAHEGVYLPRVTTDQASAGTAVTSSVAMRPGDLILVPGVDGTLAVPGHVGMYIGHGLVVDAADEQIGIIVQTYATFITVGGGLSGIRHIR